MSFKSIKTETWSVSELYNKVCGGMIHKPKFQRKKKWLLIPNNNDNVPSIQAFIEFLFETCHSINQITFGSYDNKISNIDGNNRINAIIAFINCPFDIFPDKPKPLFDKMKLLMMNGITSKRDIEECNRDIELITNIFYKMSYTDLMQFEYEEYFVDKCGEELYYKRLNGIQREFMKEFRTLKSGLKINNEDFLGKVKIPICIFEGYSVEELAAKFETLNRYTTRLTDQEIYAGRLYSVNEFEINDKRIEFEIKAKIKEYYLSISKGESLKCYEYVDDKLNAFDFMVGFQNYSHDLCKMIHESDNEGTSLYFKIFKCLFCESNTKLETALNTQNINQFIKCMQHVLTILNVIADKILVKNMVGSKQNIFETTHKKLFSLKKNNIYLIAVAIIAYIRDGVDEKVIIQSIVKCILCHIFVGCINDSDRKKDFRTMDGILYEAGGNYIDNVAKEYLKYPHKISEHITKENMINLLEYLVLENINQKPKTETKTRHKKYKIHEATLIYNYYYCKVPTQYLDSEFWVEHIVPFSCKWEVDVDIHRLGNTFPILKDMNKDRSNSHISYYEDEIKYPFVKHMEKLLPTTEIYDAIVEHKGKDVIMKDHIKYNEFCEGNERILIECFINVYF
jgi:hypothetical protein